MNKKTQALLNELNEEQVVLKERVDELDDYIDNDPNFDKETDMQRVLLVTQLNAMKMYLYTLDERIWQLSNTSGKN